MYHGQKFAVFDFLPVFFVFDSSSIFKMLTEHNHRRLNYTKNIATTNIGIYVAAGPTSNV